MDLLEFLKITGSVIGVIGGFCGILSLWLQLRQTRIMREHLRFLQGQETSVAEWSEKYDRAVALLTKIIPQVIFTGPNTTLSAFETVFWDKDLQRRIKLYVGGMSIMGRFRPARPTNEQLRLPLVQQTIQEVLGKVEKFKQDHPDYARAIKLLPPNQSS